MMMTFWNIPLSWLIIAWPQSHALICQTTARKIATNTFENPSILYDFSYPFWWWFSSLSFWRILTNPYWLILRNFDCSWVPDGDKRIFWMHSKIAFSAFKIKTECQNWVSNLSLKTESQNWVITESKLSQNWVSKLSQN